MVAINFFTRSILLLGWLYVFAQPAAAQDSVESKKTSVDLFLETYYSYDFLNPSSHEKPSFLYNHNRHNEFNINLALVNFSFTDSTKKLNLGLMAGTYPQYNLAAEPGLLQHIYQANVALKVFPKKELWVEAGIFPSHIGFESAVSKDCRTLTRSLMAENSPYYEAGLKISGKTNNNKWYLAAMILNGWQKISRTKGNNGPAFGTQITFTPGKKLSLNSSTYIGAELPDSLRQWRYFHDLYASWQLSEKWGLTVGLDAGLQQRSKSSADFNFWFTPVLIAHFAQGPWSVAGRLEYYQDDHGVIIPLVNANPFRVCGVSLNADRRIFNQALWRIEGRWLSSSPAYFAEGAVIRSGHFSITTSLSVSIAK